ncbi:hypothetical protein [Staphylococcus phage vB_SsapH-Golestan101-M]|nr:hypothetical protein [Staphylococcus phage vB_SsapH-Golestan101-M]
MISAKKARERVEYLNSEERQEEIKRSHIEDCLVYLSKRIREAVSKGEYSVEVNLRTHDPIECCLYDVNYIDDIAYRVKEKGYDVEVTIKEANVLDIGRLKPIVLQDGIKDSKIPIIKIKW